MLHVDDDADVMNAVLTFLRTGDFDDCEGADQDIYPSIVFDILGNTAASCYGVPALSAFAMSKFT